MAKKAQTASATSEAVATKVSRHLQVVMFPPRPQMSEGHILRLATETTEAEDGTKVTTAIWSNKSSSRDTAEYNAMLREIRSAALAKGYSVSEYLNCFASYQSARNQFARDPKAPNLDRDVAIIQRAMTPRPTQQPEGQYGQSYEVI